MRISQFLRSLSDDKRYKLGDPRDLLEFVEPTVAASSQTFPADFVGSHGVQSNYIRRPLPWPRQVRRLGPPEVWTLQASPMQLKPAVCLLANASNLSNPPASLSKATPSHLFLRMFKAAVCLPSNPPNPSAGLSKATTLAATCYMLQPSVFNGVQGCRLPAFKPIKPLRRPFQGNNSRSYMRHAPAIYF